jgi:hypothetical protein
MKLTYLPLVALLAMTPTLAGAQPDPNQAPKGQNPANHPPGAGRLVRGGAALTPEQQKTMMTAYLRGQLVTANVTNLKQQDAALTFVTDEFQARQKLSESARALSTATRNPATTDAQVAGLLNEYLAAIQDDKTRHQKALDTLKTSITVSQFPRLEAMLTLYGLWNDAPALSGNLMGGGNPMVAGNGRPINRRNPRQNTAPF